MFTENTLKEIKPFLHSKHIELWTWLSHNPDKDKKEWPGWEDYRECGYVTIDSYCFACEYDYQFESNCENCSIIWNDEESTNCCHKDSPFRKYGDTDTKEERAKYALEIANLPVQEGVECV